MQYTHHYTSSFFNKILHFLIYFYNLSNSCYFYHSYIIYYKLLQLQRKQNIISFKIYFLLRVILSDTLWTTYLVRSLSLVTQMQLINGIEHFYISRFWKYFIDLNLSSCYKVVSWVLTVCQFVLCLLQGA